MPKGNTSTAPETALVRSDSEASLAAVRAVIQTIPWADQDPTEKMAAFILSHPPEEWEELWQGLPSIRDLGGRQIVVEDLRIRESDFEGKLEVYLICEGTDLATGQKGLFTCSSAMSMIQLLVLYRDKKLPAKVEVVVKEKATRRGFHPIHLRYLGAHDAPLGDPGAVVSTQ